VTHHCTEDDLTLYYYGEGPYRVDRVGSRSPRRRVDQHLESCPACASLYREIAGTLAMVVAPAVPERGDQYGLEVWQRLRHKLPEQDAPSWKTLWKTLWSSVFRHDRLAFAAAAATLVLAAFVAGRVWPRQPPGAPAMGALQTAGGAASTGDSRQRILLTSVADHLDRSERVLTDIMNAPRGDISSEQRWADDLLSTSRLYRQDAVDAGEQSVAAVLDELERSLLEIVNSPSKISAADLEQIRRRIDAAALLFKVRVMSDELRQREQPPAPSSPRTSIQKVS
jgi:hypothetical protein